MSLKRTTTRISQKSWATNLASSGELGSIIVAPSLFVVNELLQQASIIEVEGIQRSEVDSDDESASSEDENVTESRPQLAVSRERPGYFSPSSTPPSSATAPDTRSGSHEGHTGLDQGTPSRRIGTIQDTYLSPALFTPRTSIFDRSPSPTRGHDYRDLLDAVIRRAEYLSDIPTN
jgi:hypothetical protein